MLLALSLSLTWTEMVELAGPSGKVQTKLPPETVTVVVPTWLPFPPQSTLTALDVIVAARGDEHRLDRLDQLVEHQLDELMRAGAFDSACQVDASLMGAGAELSPRDEHD